METPKNVAQLSLGWVRIPTKSPSDVVKKKFYMILAEFVAKDVLERRVWAKKVFAQTNERLHAENEANEASFFVAAHHLPLTISRLQMNSSAK